MNITTIPNDMLVEISRYLDFGELIRLDLIDRKLNHLVKQITWYHHTVRKFRYIQLGYNFVRCSIQIARYEITDTILANLSKYYSVQVKYTIVDCRLINALQYVKKLRFVRCIFDDIPIRMYLALRKVRSIELVHCENFRLDFVPKLNVDRFSSESAKKYELKYLTNVNKVTFDTSYYYYSVSIITDLGLTYLTNVNELTLSISNITDNSLMKLQKLQSLNLSYCNKITNNCVRSMSCLKSFNAFNCRRIVWNDNFSHIPDVNILNTNDVIHNGLPINNNVIGIIIGMNDGNANLSDSNIHNLTNANDLILYNLNDITDHGIYHLSNVNELTLLSCEYITNNGMQYLSNIKKLTLHHMHAITDEGLEYLQNVPELILNYCDGITDDGLKYCSKMYSLKLRGLKINGLGLKYLSNITKLCIDRCNNISEEYLVHLANVYDLYFSLGQITDRSLSYLTGVEILRLCTNDNITDEGIRHLSHIRILALSSIQKITNRCLDYLTQVQKLRIEGSNQITNDCIESLVNEEIYFTTWHKISGERKQELEEKYPGIIIELKQTSPDLIYLRKEKN